MIDVRTSDHGSGQSNNPRLFSRVGQIGITPKDDAGSKPLLESFIRSVLVNTLAVIDRLLARSRLVITGPHVPNLR